MQVEGHVGKHRRKHFGKQGVDFSLFFACYGICIFGTVLSLVFQHKQISENCCNCKALPRHLLTLEIEFQISRKKTILFRISVSELPGGWRAAGAS